MSHNLFLALSIPDDLYHEDEDDVADAIARILNQSRSSAAWAAKILSGDADAAEGGIKVQPVMVNAIPAPQWLTRETLHRLRILAAIDPEDIRTVLSAYEWHVPQDCWGPWRDRLAEALDR